MNKEDLIYVEKNFETEDYISTTCMLVDEKGKTHYKWVLTVPQYKDKIDNIKLSQHLKLKKLLKG